MNYLAILVLILSVGNGSKSPAKTVESKMVEVGKALYASKFEVTNFEYSDFLEDLKRRRIDTSTFQVVEENWLGLNKSEPLKVYYGSHPAFDNYPVVNVPHKGAVEFCNWLTKKYNADPKRKFTKVKFRLPSKQEWVKAASNGNEMAIFPWNTPYLQAENGHYKCNYYHVNEALLKIDLEDRTVIALDPK